MPLTAREIRQQFLDFFKSKGHIIVPSSPIVVKNDPTLLFTNAGMNQFKDFFLGTQIPQHRRVADTQKCLRVSGKHNDLEEVGKDTYHHTMFEMLGNWSFGDYFKEEAIAWAWELLTRVYQIPEDRLYATVFEGDAAEQLPEDEEAYHHWLKWLPADRILKGRKKDNFWEMGDTGPCGPCTEIHIDCRPDDQRRQRAGHTLINQNHPEVIEIWNLVFIQYNRLKDGSLEPLPARHVDTGMGLERLVRVLQGKQSNYDTDLFQPLILATEELTGIRYDGGQSYQAISFRVIADHIRALCFTIADGQLPSNTGAGYVIRRILRRAVRYSYSHLSIREPMLYRLVPVVGEIFHDVFPEVQQQSSFIAKIIFEEEQHFLKTLETGIQRIEAYFETAATREIPGQLAFELFDTYGFPIDLTRIIAAERGFSVDEAGFQQALEMQKNRSRQATALEVGDWTILSDGLTRFVGYEQLRTTSRMLRYRQVTEKGKSFYQIVLDETPFYAESGGQVGDTGWLIQGTQKIQVWDTRKENDLIVHLTRELPAYPDQPIEAHVDEIRRQKLMLNHSATHLLHAALRQVLGHHVQQKGSLVHPDYLRFDFSHFNKLSIQEIQEVEALVNAKIRENIPVQIQYLPREEALRMGAMALFGEKYGEQVRVVTMDPRFSIELCGGTHVRYTGEIGFFIITAETAVAAGVRRIEALTGEAAWQYVRQQLALLADARELLHQPRQLTDALQKLIEEKSQLEKQYQSLEQKWLQQQAKQLSQQAKKIHDVQFIGQIVDVPSADALKQLGFFLRDHLVPAYLIVLAAVIQGKAQVLIMTDENSAAQHHWHAGEWMKKIVAPLIQGGGGGQATIATGGGKNTSSLQEVIHRMAQMAQA
ncbi:alanine--tRNA ligase [Thermoflavifilum thermophilum]|nr:alanine--tRNA ligase [Thermoflavifilum thermophilum]